MKAVVMAGGEGTRLRPLTSHRPKPLVPVLNKPIMEHIILLLKEHGITDIVVTLHYLADEIEGYFGDGSEWGVSLIYSVEDTPLGTAGSVKQAEQYLKDDTFVIVSGDALTDIDLTSAIQYHRAKQALATIVLSHVANPLEFGVVITDDSGHVRRFLEKPSWGEVFSDTVNTGMYVLEPAVFEYMEPGKSYDWSQDIFPRILQEEKPLFGYVMTDYWCDVGSLNQYREAQYTVLDGQTKVKLEGKFHDHVWVGEDSEIAPDVQIISPTLIGRNVKIKNGAIIGPHTVIGDNCILEAGAIVQRSILWDNVYVGANSRLTACTVCGQVVIQRDCS
ncbi:MAG TPA: NDP-sugar synthase, partial [Chthonomonadales bacterium]|nr:NDP-sugar synthase [Chthonomonadales bacterium]